MESKKPNICNIASCNNSCIVRNLSKINRVIFLLDKKIYVALFNLRPIYNVRYKTIDSEFDVCSYRTESKILGVIRFFPPLFLRYKSFSSDN